MPDDSTLSTLSPREYYTRQGEAYLILRTYLIPVVTRVTNDIIRDYLLVLSTNITKFQNCFIITLQIDDKGNFDEEEANAWAGKEFPDEPKRLEGAKNIYNVCKKG